MPTAKFTAECDRVGVEILHAFSGREYAKEVRIPAGVELVQHSHSFDHLSILASGTAIVSVDSKADTHVGPCVLVVKAGAQHSVKAVTPVVWYCVHATECTDPAAIDATILGTK